MFNTLASYLLGTSNQPNSVEETNTRLTSASPDDDWVLLDADSEGNSESDSDSAESLDEYDVDNKHNQLPCLLTRSSSTASLPCTTMEESWFVTPPPCFTSAGPVHMQTSPLENLLIEHPSMSVYQHTHSALIAHRHSVPLQFITVSHCAREEEDDPYEGYLHDGSSEVDETDLENIYEDEIQRVEAEFEALQDRQIGLPQRRRIDIDFFRQEKKQWNTSKQAQKVQLHKSYKLLTLKYLQRATKARESTHNRRQRRSNYFHGSNRSYVNNNRKC